MKRRSSGPEGWDELRDRIIGLGERSIQKSYYPELQKQLSRLELFRLLLDRSKDAILLSSLPSGKIVDASESACAMLGYTAEAMLSMNVSDLLPGTASWEISSLQQNLPSGKTITTELRKRGGETVPVEMTLHAAAFTDGVYAVMIARDITERKKAEEEIRESRQRLSEIIDFLPDATFAIDCEGRIIAWNHAIEQMTGTRAEDMLGKGNYE